MYTAFGTIPRDATDDRWWTWYNATGGRSITVRPDNVGTTRVALSFLSNDPRLQDLDTEAQRAALAAVYADVGWQAPRILAALRTADELYLDYLTQVRTPHWARGLVDRAQKLPPGTPRLAHPRSRAGVAVMRNLLRLAGSRPGRTLAEKFSSPTPRPTTCPAISPGEL